MNWSIYILGDTYLYWSEPIKNRWILHKEVANLFPQYEKVTDLDISLLSLNLVVS
jgi:hypothetical protein